MLEMFCKPTRTTTSKSRLVTKLMETESPKVKSDALAALSIVLAVLLTDYFRMQLHGWCGLSQPLAFALGLFLAWTIALLLFGPGRLSKRIYMLLLMLISLAAYITGRMAHL